MHLQRERVMHVVGVDEGRRGRQVVFVVVLGLVRVRMRVLVLVLVRVLVLVLMRVWVQVRMRLGLGLRIRWELMVVRLHGGRRAVKTNSDNGHDNATDNGQ